MFVAHAEDQRELLGVRMREIIGRHGAERRDAGAGGDEDGFFRWIANHEESERRGHLNGIARLHREKMRSEDAFVNQIQAELEAIAIGQRNDGIGARDLLAVERFIERNELAGLEMELLDLGDFEYEVADFGRDVVKLQDRGSHAVRQCAPALHWRDRAAPGPARDGHRAAK